LFLISALGVVRGLLNGCVNGLPLGGRVAFKDLGERVEVRHTHTVLLEVKDHVVILHESCTQDDEVLRKLGEGEGTIVLVLINPILMIGRINDVGTRADLKPILVYSQVEAWVGLCITAREEVLIHSRRLLFAIKYVTNDVIIY
jgi:hypothetical protein